MTSTAIIMMIIAILAVWGGLVAAVINLNANPDRSIADDPAGTPAST